MAHELAAQELVEQDISDDQRERVLQLWDELAAFSTADVHQAWRHLAATIADWIGADSGYWVGVVRLLDGEEAERDVMHGWRVKAVTFMHPPSEGEQLAAERAVGKGPTDLGMATVAAVRGSGVFRVHRLHDGFVDLDAFRQTEYYQSHFVPFGVDDQLWVAAPVSPETEAYSVFNRSGDGRFSEADAALAGFALRALSWLQRQLFYSHGLLVAREPLTPAQREVLRLLLSEKTEKEIAVELGQSFHTTHTHVKDIFRKYNVKSRAGLMAVWLA
jgi:DNA-binding CsgD family transcriptional regulator